MATAVTCHPERKHAGLGMCSNCYQRYTYHLDVEKSRIRVRAQQRRRNEVAMGLELGGYDKHFTAQGGMCAICGSDDPRGRGRLSMDHNHNTGAFRALLCHGCNTSLGGFKEDPALLRAAAEYLERHL